MSPLYGAVLACGYVTLKWGCDTIERLLDKKWASAAFNALATFGMVLSAIAVWRVIP